jgi:hypothetical protein
MQKLRGWISHTIRMELEHELVAGVVGLAFSGAGEALAGRAAEHAADVVAVHVEFGQDLLAGEGADVAEEEHLARLDTGLGGDPAGAGLERGAVGLGVVALEAVAAALPAVLVFGGAEHDPGARGPEVCEVGVGGVDVPLVGGDHVPAGLLEPAREAARAGEQVDPDRLRVRGLDRRGRRRVREVSPVG